MNSLIKEVTKHNDIILKIEWSHYIGWELKILKRGCDRPVVEVKNNDYILACTETSVKLLEYLKSRKGE